MFVIVPFKMGGAASAVRSIVTPAHPGLTVDRVNTLLYMGRWYQKMSTPTPFQRVGVPNVIAQYELINNASGTQKFSVDNYEPDPGRDNDETVVRHIHGIASTSPDHPNDVGKYDVEFQGSAGFTGQYWIYGLGGQDKDEPYPWAIVGDPTLSYVWVLVRNPRETKYNDEIVKRLKELQDSHPTISIISRLQETEHTDYWNRYMPPDEHHSSQFGVRTHRDRVKRSVPAAKMSGQISGEMINNTHTAIDFTA